MVIENDRKYVHRPAHVFPSPVYTLLQVHSYVPGPVSVHVANLWQSSLSVPQIFGSKNTKNKHQEKFPVYRKTIQISTLMPQKILHNCNFISDRGPLKNRHSLIYRRYL